MHSTFPDDENGDALRNMARAGDDLSKERDINFSVIFPREQSALEFCQKVARQGVKSNCYRRREKDEIWDVTVTQLMLPTHNNISDFEQFLAEVARPLEGENDGWGCFSA